MLKQIPERDGRSGSARAAAPSKGAPWLTQVALPLSLGLYGIGFVVATPHLVRAGVPVYSLDSHIFLAAGALLFFLFFFAYFVAESFIAAYRASSGGLLRKIVATIIKEMIPLWASWSVGGLRALLFVLSSAAALALLLRLRDEDDDLIAEVLRAPQLVASHMNVVLGILAAFALLVYPVVHVKFGGGRPQELRRIPVANGQLWLQERDEWARDLCHTTALRVGKSACRTVYRVHEDASYLYLAVEDSLASCEREAAEYVPWQLAPDGERFCFMRMPQDAMRFIQFDVQPP